MLEGNVATFLVAGLVFVAAVVGGVVVIVEPATLNFNQYLDRLEQFAVAVGLLAVGRGLNSGLKSR